MCIIGHVIALPFKHVGLVKSMHLTGDKSLISPFHLYTFVTNYVVSQRDFIEGARRFSSWFQD